MASSAPACASSDSSSMTMTSSSNSPAASGSGPKADKDNNLKRSRCDDDDDEDEEDSTVFRPPDKVRFFGSHNWTINNYHAAAKYMRKAQAEMRSETFYLSNESIHKVRGFSHDCSVENHANMAFQIGARVNSLGHLVLKLCYGWGQMDNSTEWNDNDYYKAKVKRAKEESQAQEEPDMIAYSFCLQAPAHGLSQPFVDSSRYFYGEVDRNESFQLASNGDPSKGLLPFLPRFRCEGVRALIDGQDLNIAVNCKGALTVGSVDSARKYRRAAIVDRLYRTMEHSDVILVAAGGQRFQAHRSILSARSSVFRAMFSHPELAENQTREVQMDDVEPEVLGALLRFIYKDQFQAYKQVIEVAFDS